MHALHFPEIYPVKCCVFLVFLLKRHFTAQRGVSELCARVLTPPKIQFYLLGGIARSIGRGLDGVGTPFIPQSLEIE